MAWLAAAGRNMRRALSVLALAVPFMLGGGEVALAANTGCSVSGATANCGDVPSDGISYQNSVDTVTVGNGTSGSATVGAGTIGIRLSETGVDSDVSGV